MIDRSIKLETKRLVLRATTPADAQRLAEIQSNWNVTRMLRLATWPVDQVAFTAWIASHEPEWHEGSAYRFAVELNGHVIGQCDVDDLIGDQGEIGYWYDEAHWGRGYAVEAAAALLDFARTRLKLHQLHAGHDAENPNSGKVLERLGFKHHGDTTKFSKPYGAERAYRTYRFTPR